MTHQFRMGGAARGVGLAYGHDPGHRPPARGDDKAVARLHVAQDAGELAVGLCGGNGLFHGGTHVVNNTTMATQPARRNLCSSW